MSEEYPSEQASSTENLVGYKVEARMNYIQPTMIGNQIFDKEWRVVHYEKREDGLGIPADGWPAVKLNEHNIYGFAAAQALRWWLHAAADSAGHGLCLESRLVKHTLTITTKLTAVSNHEVVGSEDRTNCMPKEE